MQEFRLVMKQGPNVGKSFELKKDIVTLGRDLSNDIIVNDAEMSRHHSRLIRQGTSYVIEDLGSTNGTFVNSTRTTAQVLLKAGDTINLGDTVTLTFEMPTGGSAEAATMMNAVGLDTDAKRPANVASYTPPPPAQSISAEPATRASNASASSNNKLWIGLGVGCLILVCCVITVAVAIFVISLNR